MSAAGPLREPTGSAELGTAAKDVGSGRGLRGFGAVGRLGRTALPRKNAADPCHTVFCPFQGLNGDMNPGVSPTSHLLLGGCS